MDKKYKTISALGSGLAGLGFFLYTLVCPVKANAAELNKNAEGNFIVSAQNNDSYTSNGMDDGDEVQTLYEWMVKGLSDKSEIKRLSSIYKIVKDNAGSESTIEWDLNEGSIKLKGQGIDETMYGGFNFIKNYAQPAGKQELDIDEAEAMLEEDEAQNNYQQPEKKNETKQEAKAENPIDTAVKNAKDKEQNKEQKKKEIKRKEIKKKVVKNYDNLPQEEQKEVAEFVSYVTENNNGFRKKYPFDDFESLTNVMQGMDFSELKKGLAPTARIFRIYGDSTTQKADTYVIDMCNEEWKSAVLFKVDNQNKIQSAGLLLEKDLNDKVFEYATDKRLKVETLDDVLANLGNLRRDNADVIKDLKGKYKEGVVFLYTPERNGVKGVAYHVKNNVISEIVNLNKDAFYRSAEPVTEISLAGNDNHFSFETLLARDGRVRGTRGKLNAIYDNNMLKQAQLSMAITNNMNEQLVFGGSLFQDQIGNWQYTEGDVFTEYLKNNLAIKFLTGNTTDKTTYADTVVGNLTAKQNREGKSNPLINGSVAYAFPGQMPLVWGKPTLKVRGATVSGNDSYNYDWQDVNGLSIAQGSVIKPSDYTTAVLGIQNKWGFGRGKTANLAALVESETNNFRQEKNGKMIDNINAQTRIGLIGSYDKESFKPSLAVIYQLNKNVDGTENCNIAGVLQVAGMPLNNLAVIANGYCERLNDSKGASLNIAYSPRAQKYLEHEGQLKRDIAMWNVSNNASLLPEVHPNVSNISPIYEGILASLAAGNDKYGTTFKKAAIDFYVGKNCAAGYEYSESGSDKKSMLKLKKAFR